MGKQIEYKKCSIPNVLAESIVWIFYLQVFADIYRYNFLESKMKSVEYLHTLYIIVLLALETVIF